MPYLTVMVFILLAVIVAILGLVFLVRYLVECNARSKGGKTPQQLELDRMKANDL